MVCTLDPIRTRAYFIFLRACQAAFLRNARIKLIDFGSACAEFHMMHTYIQSRFYRWVVGIVLSGMSQGFPVGDCILVSLWEVSGSAFGASLLERG